VAGLAVVIVRRARSKRWSSAAGKKHGNQESTHGQTSAKRSGP
jgi:hypothetical protein